MTCGEQTVEMVQYDLEVFGLNQFLNTDTDLGQNGKAKILDIESAQQKG